MNLKDNDENEIYKALVSDLAFSLVPTAIMAATIVSVGGYAYAVSHETCVLICTVVVLLANLSKILFNALHRGPLFDRTASLAQVRQFDIGHAIASLVVAASTGALAAFIFRLSDVTLHLVATAMLFGYCAGIIARLSVRPRIAIAALLLAAIPGSFSVAMAGDHAHQMVALIFLAFTLGSIGTIRHSHLISWRHLTIRQKMTALARRDPLTQLLNRYGLREAYEALPMPAGQWMALHLFDLDGFKAVNDKYGHQAGDTLLTQLAERLNAAVPEGSLVARMGGDEFIVIQQDLKCEETMMAFARRLHDVLSSPYGLDPVGRREVGVSLGCTIRRYKDTSLDELISRADQASYLAKRGGGGVKVAPETPRSRKSTATFQSLDAYILIEREGASTPGDGNTCPVSVSIKPGRLPA